ncbi:MAG: hypothetical protein H0T47_21915 [Planctomycetaceae bacterium]|nr:hypothetical protein [Planctomycetaceae bacterium]
MSNERYGSDVFINCPFDAKYAPIFQAVVFCIFECGFRARCALEIDDSGQVRLERIVAIIRDCRLGIHDLSRTESDAATGLPRFNMPLELGLFLAAKWFGSGKQRDKVCLILDREPYRYQAFISDIAGQDIRDHHDEPTRVIAAIRRWLRPLVKDRPLPGETAINARYDLFRSELPEMCRELKLTNAEITFIDLTHLVEEWLRVNG